MQKIKLFIAIGVALLLLLATVYGALMIRSSQPKTPSPQVREFETSPAPPVDGEIDQSFQGSPFAYPKMQQQLDSTGALDEELTEDERESADARGSLWDALPIETNTFRISADYNRAKYAVTFSDSSNPVNQDAFEQWLEDTYPAISLEEFILVP